MCVIERKKLQHRQNLQKFGLGRAFLADVSLNSPSKVDTFTLLNRSVGCLAVKVRLLHYGACQVLLAPQSAPNFKLHVSGGLLYAEAGDAVAESLVVGRGPCKRVTWRTVLSGELRTSIIVMDCTFCLR